MNLFEQKEFAELLGKNSPTNILSQQQHLFSYICELSTYEEKEVKTQLKKYIPQSSFPVVKNSLREKLQAYLLSREPQSGTHQIHQMLNEVEMLFNRQLYFEAEIICHKIIDITIRLDINHFVIEANSWRILLQPFVTTKNYDKKIKSITDLSQLYLQKMELSFKLGTLNETVLAYTYQDANMRSSAYMKKIHAWLKHPLLQISSTDKRIGISNLLLLEITKMQLYRMLGKFEDAYQSQKRMMKAMLADWDFYLKNKKPIVASIVQNHFGAVSLTHHFADFAKHLQLVEKLLKSDYKNNRHMFLSYTLNKFYYEIITKKNTVSPLVILQFEKFYLKERSNISLHFRSNYSLIYSLAMYYTAQYQKAMDALQFEINEYRRANVREDLLEDFQISLLMQHFMLLLSKKQTHESVNQFQKCLEPIYHSFRKKPKNEEYDFEMCLIHLFRKFHFHSTPKQILTHLLKTENELNRLFTNPSPNLIVASSTFDHKEYIARCKQYLL